MRMCLNSRAEPTKLTAENLSKSFGTAALLRALALDRRARATGVSGRNGSGKTTLLKILAGLTRPTAGPCSSSATGARSPATDRRLAVGWCGPRPRASTRTSPPRRTCASSAAPPGGRLSARTLRGRLADVGLEGDALGRRVEEFSTGMRQRLRLAFSTLFDPPILLLLTSRLSGSTRRAGRRLAALVARRRERGAVVVASNDERDFVGRTGGSSWGRP